MSDFEAGFQAAARRACAAYTRAYFDRGDVRLAARHVDGELTAANVRKAAGRLFNARFSDPSARRTRRLEESRRLQDIAYHFDRWGEPDVSAWDGIKHPIGGRVAFNHPGVPYGEALT